MLEKFAKSGTNTVSSSKGFEVEVKPAGGVLYRDTAGEKLISSEWLVKGSNLGIILYKGSPGNKGFSEMPQSDVDEIFSNSARALEYLGYKTEIWSSPTG